ncbi:TetR/AcrR family transcriptional regulator [Nocardia sp. NPDC051030]|uniref:TetR/AcrR family transcriptional regulator n=1 Tax=Nocardia sp. NPDC051030 TaxID=3155162 RepID=UPI003424EBF0
MTTSGQGPGRPRETRIDHTVTTATRELLAEHGYAALTVNAVAQRAGVGKAAIYRRFGSKAEMAFAAVVHDREVPPVPDTGSLRGDLGEMVRTIHAAMSNPLAMDVIPALLAELGKDPELGPRWQQSSFAMEREYIAQLLDQARARGELDADSPDDVTVVLLLAGPIFYALYGFRLPVDEAQIDRLVDIIAAGLLRSAR